MKKIFFILGVLLSLGMFCACSSDDEIVNREGSIGDYESRGNNVTASDSTGYVSGGVVYDGWGKPEVDPSDPLAVFMRDELHGNYWDGAGNEFKTFFEQGSWDDESILVINSSQEFQEAYMGTKELPDVDFDNYTLVIGRTWGGDSSWRVANIILRDKGINYELETLLYHHIDWGAFCAIVKIYYWHLYPKLEKKDIIIKRTVEEVTGDSEG
jgi:hypothetical protein